MLSMYKITGDLPWVELSIYTEFQNCLELPQVLLSNRVGMEAPGPEGGKGALLGELQGLPPKWWCWNCRATFVL